MARQLEGGRGHPPPTDCSRGVVTPTSVSTGSHHFNFASTSHGRRTPALARVVPGCRQNAIRLCPYHSAGMRSKQKGFGRGRVARPFPKARAGESALSTRLPSSEKDRPQRRDAPVPHRDDVDTARDRCTLGAEPPRERTGVGCSIGGPVLVEREVVGRGGEKAGRFARSSPTTAAGVRSTSPRRQRGNAAGGACGRDYRARTRPFAEPADTRSTS